MTEKYQFISTLSRIPWKEVPSWVIGNRLRILMYHSISNNPHDPHTISPSEFRRQMQFLQTKEVISFTEGIDQLKQVKILHNKWIITFDDGLLDFYTTAVPILREFDYPSTMFVPTGLVGSKAKWDSYDKSKPLMNWEQLDSCQQWKVTFGSHSVHHLRLTELDNEKLLEECVSSINTLETKLTNTIRALAYPGGFHNDRVHQMLRKAGYQYGLIASSHWGNGKDTDFFQLRREKLNQ